MIPLLLVVLGAAALGTGWFLLRSLGPGARVGRIIAATPVVPIGRAVGMASEDRPHYVGVLGRVDSAEDFHDENDRPLVIRRTRLELERNRRWTTLEANREVVPFDINEALDHIAVDGAELDEGLVVVTRESIGTAADLGDRAPAGTPPEARARLRIDLLSSVDHALVLGVPTVDPERGPILRAGLGRPLILTNLEAKEAMRLLAAGRQGTARAISLLLGGGTAAILAGVAWAGVDALL
ncbi:MAG TPA: hypothetical protein VES19_01290 [Candidatus Limnocylindrales bacterium]|nr:hypothetical protein [Candidatus Limnocylindrales bacterium]